ncbi:hypothetical protein FGIG_11825 [Fasciola gigantica]|uniref:Uncharacterized protein n=1 Tax=Fasciola gigantica TaxID=46835 RepID=A0A504Z3D7_FASGI|nr:hypothetical protein FGIG_11825 [Fasciola gigantica]
MKPKCQRRSCGNRPIEEHIYRQCAEVLARTIGTSSRTAMVRASDGILRREVHKVLRLDRQLERSTESRSRRVARVPQVLHFSR